MKVPAAGQAAAFGIGTRVILLLLVGAYLFPLYWMITGSLQPATDSLRIPPVWIPSAPNLDNYVHLFDDTGASRWFLNSLVVSAFVSLGAIITSSTAGYALGAKHFPGARLLFWLVVLAIAIPTSVSLVPLFLIMRNLGWINTYAGLIAPDVAFPFGVFLMSQFIHTIPSEMYDAARCDGASEWRIFERIVLPLTRPVQAAIGIFAFIGSWNHYLWQVVVTNTREMQTLPVGVATLAYGVEKIDLGLSLAGATVSFLPMLLIFLFFQRQFQSGITAGALR